MIGFRRLNHNLDFSFFHVKNPVGEFSPTGFVEQPKFTNFVVKIYALFAHKIFMYKKTRNADLTTFLV